jgi:hypothetical protein
MIRRYKGKHGLQAVERRSKGTTEHEPTNALPPTIPSLVSKSHAVLGSTRTITQIPLHIGLAIGLFNFLNHTASAWHSIGPV